MTVARSVADVLDDHVSLEVECIDRMYLNVYQPRLQHVNGVVWFFRGHRGAAFASSALMDPITKRFVSSIHHYCAEHDVPLIDFARGERKDDVAHAYFAEFQAAGRTEGVLFVGRAQEKTRTFWTEKRRNPVTGATYPWIVSGTAMVNHFYVYAVDADFGPFFPPPDSGTFPAGQSTVTGRVSTPVTGLERKSPLLLCMFTSETSCSTTTRPRVYGAGAGFGAACAAPAVSTATPSMAAAPAARVRAFMAGLRP
jgi:hypothetical protein